MKKKLKIKNLKYTRTEINFVRVYPYYLSQNNESWSFQVTLKCRSPLNKKTGMSVSLVGLDRVAESIFRNEICNLPSLISFLKEKVNQLKMQLQKQNMHLVAVHFDECRKYGIHFSQQDVFFVRTDYAKNEAGDLYEVITYLNSKQSVVQLQLKNFKNKITEQIIF